VVLHLGAGYGIVLDLRVRNSVLLDLRVRDSVRLDLLVDDGVLLELLRADAVGRQVDRRVTRAAEATMSAMMEMMSAGLGRRGRSQFMLRASLFGKGPVVPFRTAPIYTG
jgi:hypothetical protein